MTREDIRRLVDLVNKSFPIKIRLAEANGQYGILNVTDDHWIVPPTTRNLCYQQLYSGLSLLTAIGKIMNEAPPVLIFETEDEAYGGN